MSESNIGVHFENIDWILVSNFIAFLEVNYLRVLKKSIIN